MHSLHVYKLLVQPLKSGSCFLAAEGLELHLYRLRFERPLKSGSCNAPLYMQSTASGKSVFVCVNNMVYDPLWLQWAKW